MAEAGADGLAARLESARARIAAAAAAAARRPGSCAPTLIAVSKTMPLEAIEGLYALGQRDFGENYAQELVAKAEAARAHGLDAIRWHFIGHLQSNKVNALIPWIASVHSVDSLRLATRLDEAARRRSSASPLSVFIEVNIDAEPSKAGLLPDEVPALALAMAGLSGLRLEGLMCVPQPVAAGGEASRPFRRLRELGESLGQQTQGGLSMGMSADFELALREGATHVRLGTVLFGARPQGPTGRHGIGD